MLRDAFVNWSNGGTQCVTGETKYLRREMSGSQLQRL